jgi:hypothetical protein
MINDMMIIEYDIIIACVCVYIYIYIYNNNNIYICIIVRINVLFFREHTCTRCNVELPLHILQNGREARPET